MGQKEHSEKIVNRNLIALVAVIFLFYGGLSCLYSTFVPHLLKLGFYTHEIRNILTTVAIISIIGPLIFAALTDRIADRRKANYGRYLQIIIALLLILASIAYGLLLLVPGAVRIPSRVLKVSFGCDKQGAVVFQERCDEQNTCYHWDSAKEGSLVLTNCSYTCQSPENFESLYNPWVEPPEASAAPLRLQSKQSSLPESRERDDYDYDSSGPNRR